MRAVQSEQELKWTADGLAELETRGPFSMALGPMFHRKADSTDTFLVEVKPHHCNGIGIAHGGFISTIADLWMWHQIARHTGRGKALVTVSIGVDFVSPAVAGSILESHIDVLKVGRHFTTAEGRIICNERVVASMRGMFTRIGD